MESWSVLFKIDDLCSDNECVMLETAPSFAILSFKTFFLLPKGVAAKSIGLKSDCFPGRNSLCYSRTPQKKKSGGGRGAAAVIQATAEIVKFVA